MPPAGKRVGTDLCIKLAFEDGEPYAAARALDLAVNLTRVHLLEERGWSTDDAVKRVFDT